MNYLLSLSTNCRYCRRITVLKCAIQIIQEIKVFNLDTGCQRWEGYYRWISSSCHAYNAENVLETYLVSLSMLTAKSLHFTHFLFHTCTIHELLQFLCLSVKSKVFHIITLSEYVLSCNDLRSELKENWSNCLISHTSVFIINASMFPENWWKYS